MYGNRHGATFHRNTVIACIFRTKQGSPELSKELMPVEAAATGILVPSADACLGRGTGTWRQVQRARSLQQGGMWGSRSVVSLPAPPSACLSKGTRAKSFHGGGIRSPASFAGSHGAARGFQGPVRRPHSSPELWGNAKAQGRLPRPPLSFLVSSRNREAGREAVL